MPANFGVCVYYQKLVVFILYIVFVLYILKVKRAVF